MSKEIDFNKAQIHILNAYTLGELVAFYSPHSAPDRKEFGNIYMNAGQMIMSQMEAAEEIIRAAEDAQQEALNEKSAARSKERLEQELGKLKEGRTDA